MPQPTSSDVHVNTPLTNLSIAYKQRLEMFVHPIVFPPVRVTKQSDRYFTYTRASWNRIEMKKRAPASQSAGGGWDLDNTANYFADKYAIHKDVDDDTRANADAVIDMDRDAMEWCTYQAMLRREKLWAERFFIPSTWTGSTTGGDITPTILWSAAGSTPIQDITKEITSVVKKTGRKPQKFVAGPRLHDVLRNHPDVVERIKFVQIAAQASVENALASLIGVDDYLVAWGIHNTAAEGAAEASAFMMDSESALLVYAAPNPGLMQPSGGYIFEWDRAGVSPQGIQIKRFRIDEIDADRIECNMWIDPKLVAPELGVFFLNAVSP